MDLSNTINQHPLIYLYSTKLLIGHSLEAQGTSGGVMVSKVD